jgi:hypothetical protein
MGTQSLFTGIKRPGPGVSHPLLSGAEVKGRVELLIYPHIPDYNNPLRDENYLYR